MPHSDETFYKMAVGWPDDPKVVALGRFGAVNAILARDLFSQMIGYSRRNLTDGEVPAQEVGRLMHPLPADLAEELAGYLADPGPFGALCRAHTTSNADGNAGSNADGNAARIVSWVVLNYAKWNDTAADVQGRKAQGRQAAKTRWSRADADSTADGNAGSNAGWSPSGILDRDAPGIHRARGRVHTEQEQERDTPLPPARSDARRTGRATTARGGGPRTTHPNVQAAMADAHRPGGPARDVAGWAAKARAGITKPDEPEQPGPMNQGPQLEPGKHVPPDRDPEPAQQDPEPDEEAEPAEDEIPFLAPHPRGPPAP
jgi:hypothetical protein